MPQTWKNVPQGLRQFRVRSYLVEGEFRFFSGWVRRILGLAEDFDWQRPSDPHIKTPTVMSMY